ncbi:vWA domain-containing protein [Vibrio mediterranei]|uniref:Transporter n=1 Tax=Vibrio mediterranei TaxID=689 RepID=A0ABX5DE18_9VIBR|nr:VWA domain-containing protein [Vibrio mediterranei]PCD88424.1 transporter [Vibrio mediterranei]PRQ66710.1 transporter [Vibrio mediterranei]
MTGQALIEQFHFLRPLGLLLLIPLLSMVYLRWRNEAKRSEWMTRLPIHLRDALLVGRPNWFSQLPLKGLTLVGVIAIIIVAGPSWYRQASPFAEDTAPLVVVLDVSSSMSQSDVAPSRLFIAKQKVLQLLKLHNKGKVSLVVFSGSAHLVMPPTQDLALFEPLLNAIKPNVVPRDGKFAEYTLSPIHQVLSKAKSSGTVLLVTDGLSNEAIIAYQDYFSSHNHQLLIWGIGHSDTDVVFPLEERKLASLANRVDGQSVMYSLNNKDVVELASLIAKHAQFYGEESEPWYDSGYYLLVPLMLLYLLWFRRGWLVQWGMVIVMLLGSGYSPTTYADSIHWMDIWLTKDQQGQRLFAQQQYELAAKTFEEPYWRATAYYLSGDYISAQQYYMRVDTTASQLGAAASLAHQREYMAARQLYRDILDREPANVTATQNLELMERIIQHINEFSEGQLTSGEMEASKELGDKPQTAEGVTQEVDPSLLQEQKLTAEDLLADSSVHDKWMKRVNSDLSVFLTYKFHRQLEMGVATQRYVEQKGNQ